MVVLSARFTFLASLCALVAIAIPPRAEAAHIYAGHSMQKQVSSPRPHRRTPSASFLGRHGAAHGHDEKNEGQHPDSPEHRSLGLPPLLRRHTVSDHTQAGHDQHDQGHHDYASHKVSGSVFARSRYRQGPAAHYRRSSVYVPGEQGDMYLVSGSLPKDGGEGNSGTGKLRRQADESDLALGRIDIMTASQSPPGTQRLASLTVNSTPIDWTSGQTTAKAFPLNASTNNQTQFIMMPLDSPGGFNKHVTLATEVFDASNAMMVMYCATFDPDPGATSALLMTPCAIQSVQVNDASDPCAGQNDASPPSQHESQVFSYDPSTGKIEPISSIATSSDSGGSADDDDSDPCVVARSIRRRDNASSTTSSSTKPSISSTSAAPSASALQQARNVTLVYVAGALEVPASASSSTSSSASSNSVSTSGGQAPAPAPASAAVVTTTLTTTVLATATASGSGSKSSSSSRTVSPAQAAVSVSVSSQPPSPSATTIVPKPPASGTPAHPNSVNPTSTVPKPPAAASSKVPANADESFEVEVVGIAPSTTSGASLPTSATTSHSSISLTLDPLVVATSVAKQAAHR